MGPIDDRRQLPHGTVEIGWVPATRLRETTCGAEPVAKVFQQPAGAATGAPRTAVVAYTVADSIEHCVVLLAAGDTKTPAAS